MGARARWIAFSVVLSVALGSAALYLSSTNFTMATSPQRGPKTWLVQPGETLRVQADEVLTEDRFVCTDPRGSTGTSRSKHSVTGFGQSSMVVDAAGNVTVYCVPL